MGRPTPESLARVKHDIQFAFTEAPDIGKLLPQLQLGVFQFDHGRRLSHSIKGLVGEIYSGTHDNVRRDVASTAVKLLAIENARRKGVSETKVNELRENLHLGQVEDAYRSGKRRITVDTQWNIASMLVYTLTDPTTTMEHLSSLKEPLIDATALEVDSPSRE